MKSSLFLLLGCIIFTSCGHKSEDEVNSPRPQINDSAESNSQVEKLTGQLDDLNSYEAHEMKAAGLVFMKSLTIQNDQTIASFNFDRSKISPTSSPEALAEVMQVFVTKAQDLLDKAKNHQKNKDGVEIQLDETTQMDLRLKIELCQNKMKLLNELKTNTAPDLQLSDMNKEINEISASESAELRPIGLAFNNKETYINGHYSKSMTLEFINPSNTLPSRTYVEALAKYITKGSDFLQKYKAGSFDQFGNKQDIPEIFKQELTIKIELSKNVIREILD